MTRPVARAKKNQKAYAQRPTSQGQHVTTLGIMSSFEGFLKKARWIDLLKNDIIDLFKNTSRYLILDNAPAHKSPDVIALLQEHKINYLFIYF